MDIANPASIARAFAEVGAIDAVACAAGAVKFSPLSAFEPEDVATSGYGWA